MYQAQIDAGNAKSGNGTHTKTVESLARALHEGKLVGAGLLIPSAHREGVMYDVHRVLSIQAMQFAKKHDIAVSLNIDPAVLGHESFADDLIEWMEDARIDPEQLEVELLESTSMENIERCKRRKQMQRLFGKKPCRSGAVVKGIKGVADDLPCENSLPVLGELKSLGRSDKVKIDVRLVKELIHQDKITRGRAEKKVRKILKAAADIGAQVVFEGVDPGQIDLIVAIESMTNNPRKTLMQVGNPEDDPTMGDILSGRRQLRPFGQTS